MKELRILALVLAIAGVGCDTGSDGNGSEAVTIEFAAKVGTEEFVCGETYDNLGANDTSLQLSDFRFYVQDLELKSLDGSYVAVELDTDGAIWQTDNLALLDFENGCNDSGTTEMNAVVTGTVPVGAYDGIRFKMGVPFDLNHDNPATAPAPLQSTTMQWSWQGGYKFLRIDSGSFSMTDWRMHLGSTDCDGDPVAGGTTSCSNPNRVDVELAGFDPEGDTIVADFAALVDGAALDVNQAQTPVGCMADPVDGDCGPVFENLGLPFEGSPAGAQRFFTVE
jgi:uncharacterized repeat protein (TIGR04052 family)